MSQLIPKTNKENRVSPSAPLLTPPNGSALGTPTSREPSARDTRKKTQWKVIAEKTGVQATKERLKSYWTTVGIFSALTMTMTYSSVTNPTVTTRHNAAGMGGADAIETEEPLVIAYVVLSATSLVVSIGILVMSVVLLAEVDLVCTDEDLDGFIDKFQGYFIWLTAVFGFTCFTLMSSIAVAAFYFYSTGTAIATSVVCVVVTVVTALVSTDMAVYTRGKLRRHVDAANATVKAVLEKLKKVSAAQQAQQQPGAGAGPVALPLVPAAAAGGAKPGSVSGGGGGGGRGSGAAFLPAGEAAHSGGDGGGGGGGGGAPVTTSMFQPRQGPSL
ncbi:hypothetical protein HYH02_006644 [Chlamydomonas schloesseri]|uniref:Uncharacterized protein n=1 Tax=Chlamydomonas schloesseri TaxID=2026947 RepID=A0A835W1H3_9CHLO|nr:hypothetical protein HYH02_006644 [Chlamydomonas schloesseri]|eukprot:KAG2432656.1 hypothetical protein HYH02_006644 [Chlamydomonas schloesseri]